MISAAVDGDADQWPDEPAHIYARKRRRRNRPCGVGFQWNMDVDRSPQMVPAAGDAPELRWRNTQSLEPCRVASAESSSSLGGSIWLTVSSLLSWRHFLSLSLSLYTHTHTHTHQAPAAVTVLFRFHLHPARDPINYVFFHAVMLHLLPSSNDSVKQTMVWRILSPRGSDKIVEYKRVPKGLKHRGARRRGKGSCKM